MGDGERGSISVIAVGIIAGVLALTGSIAGITTAFVAKQRVAGAADAAAVAAADAASGAVSGYPCERAAETATLNGASLIECIVDGPIASVRVSAQFLAFEVRARARAGPQESAVWQSVEDGLQVAILDGARPAVERVVGREFDSATSRVEVALAAGFRSDLDPGAGVAGLQELGGDGLAFERTIGQFRGVRPH
ncbi:Rv3654c family TadE-like protein [Diaminobutyricibacter tongyongensis]|uniref:Rv3654c family TadE-like protein n=1 Tax=Leifsonia tongyongensis TaxID=1268043 RepID=UPI0030843ED3